MILYYTSLFIVDINKLFWTNMEEKLSVKEQQEIMELQVSFDEKL